MALRLAGEEYSVIQGLDYDGWLRDIQANDGNPGLKVNQKSTGRIFAFQDGGTSIFHALDNGDIVFPTNRQVGIGVIPTAPFQVRASNPSVTAHGDAVMAIEKNGAAALQISTPNNVTGSVLFGDPENNVIGYFQYNHIENELLIGANNAQRAKISSTALTLLSLFTEMDELTDPAAPAANKSRLYTKDNGAGKTQLVVRFPTGAVQVIATEP